MVGCARQGAGRRWLGLLRAHATPYRRAARRSRGRQGPRRAQDGAAACACRRPGPAGHGPLQHPTRPRDRGDSAHLRGTPNAPAWAQASRNQLARPHSHQPHSRRAAYAQATRSQPGRAPATRDPRLRRAPHRRGRPCPAGQRTRGRTRPGCTLRPGAQEACGEASATAGRSTAGPGPDRPHQAAQASSPWSPSSAQHGAAHGASGRTHDVGTRRAAFLPGRPAIPPRTASSDRASTRSPRGTRARGRRSACARARRATSSARHRTAAADRAAARSSATARYPTDHPRRCPTLANNTRRWRAVGRASAARRA